MGLKALELFIRHPSMTTVDAHMLKVEDIRYDKGAYNYVLRGAFKIENLFLTACAFDSHSTLDFLECFTSLKFFELHVLGRWLELATYICSERMTPNLKNVDRE